VRLPECPSGLSIRVTPMPLAPSSAPRKRLHTRRISYEGWQREDGLFDIEARIVAPHPSTQEST
jgi:hypothetical protein